MKRSRFPEEQIIGILKEREAGAKTADVCRRHGICDATFYNWKAKYGGMEVSEAKRLKALAGEHVRRTRWRFGVRSTPMVRLVLQTPNAPAVMPRR